MCILYYDDDADTRELIEIILSKHCKSIITKSRVLDVIEEVREVNPQLIIMDLHLPGISGEEAVLELKQNQLTRTIPVMLVSGEYNLGATAARLGAEYYLEKPFLIEELEQEVNKIKKVIETSNQTITNI